MKYVEDNTAHEPHLHYLEDPDFALECHGAQENVRYWWPIWERIKAAAGPVAAMEQEARALGIPRGRVVKYYYLLENEGWEGVINRQKYPHPKEANLPHAFRQWLKQVYEQQQRGQQGKETVRVTMARLAAWERAPHDADLLIPGYDEPPLRTIKGYPHGWSPRNLMRHLSNDFEKAMRRQGPKRATQFLPYIYTTREGLAAGQLVYFDDQVHDTFINVTGHNPKEMRPLSFNCLDALTGYAHPSGLKPQLWNEKTGGRQELDGLDFFWYVMHYLTNVGYNARTGTTLIFEHGKANTEKTKAFDFDDAIASATGGLVNVDRSGIFREPGFRGMLFEGQPSGNFRFKAPLESWFNRFRNTAALLPGPTGRNPALAPEENYTSGRGLLGYNKACLALIDELPRARFLNLQREIWEWEDYAWAARLIEKIINRREEHELEGWIKCGFTGQRYRLRADSDHWISEEEWQLIPAEERSALAHLIRRPGCFDGFRLSPEAAWKRATDPRAGGDTLTRLPMHAIATLAPQRAWEPITVTPNLELTIKDPWIDSEPLRYRAIVRTPHGHEVILKRGAQYRRLVNIFDPSRLWIAEAEGSRRGALIGTAHRIEIGHKLQPAAVLVQLGEVAHIKAVEMKDVSTRTESAAAARVAMRDHNRTVLDATPEERAAARESERLQQSAAAFGAAIRQTEPLPPAEPAPTTHQSTDHIPTETWA